MQSDLISRCRLKSSISREDGIVVGGYRYIRAAAVMAKIDAAPGVDAVFVVHGRNLYPPLYTTLFECSACGWECGDTCGGDTEVWNYCPNCGAKMDGGAEG